MGTMTVSEAYYVVHDIVGPALLAPRGGHARKPVSQLKGYDLVQICTAFNLLIANSFLLYANRDVFEEAVAEEKFAGCVKDYLVPSAALWLFVPDDQVDVLEAKAALDFDDPRFLAQETASSFGDYCRFVGADDPLYWQKVYSRVGLEYTANSPRENHVQPPRCNIDDSGIRDHFRTIVSAFADTVRSNPCFIGDCGNLPHPKKTILYAICWLREHYERRLEGADATDQAAIERYCESMSWLLTHAVDVWHQIEPVDKEAVAKLNKCASFPDWALPLKAKYINEEAASKEACDITIDVMEDTVAYKKRRLHLLSSSAGTSEAPSEASLDPIRSSASTHRARQGGRVSGLRAAIRWILALPGGVLAAAIVAFPVHWFVMVNFGGWANEPLIEIRDPVELREIEYFLQSVFGPLASVYCAARTVPRYNRLVAVLLTVAIVLGLPLFSHWWNSEVIARGHGVLLERGVLRTLASVVGCGGAIWLVHRHAQGVCRPASVEPIRDERL